MDYYLTLKKMSYIIDHRGEATGVGSVLATALQAQDLIRDVCHIFRVANVN